MPNKDFLKNNMTERRRVEVWPVHQKHEGQRGTVKSEKDREDHKGSKYAYSKPKVCVQKRSTGVPSGTWHQMESNWFFSHYFIIFIGVS